MSVSHPPSPAGSILFIPLEFQDWSRARHLSYASFLGLEEGFRANGADVTTVPAAVSFSPGEGDGKQAGYWLDWIRPLCRNRKFDQVWVEAVHSHLDAGILEFLAGIAPVRVALIGESLAYAADISARHPHLGARKALVEGRLAAFSHAIVADERDAADLNARGVINAVWLPPSIPERFIGPDVSGPRSARALYPFSAERELSPWMDQGRLSALMQAQPSPEAETGFSAQFDAIHGRLDGAFAAGMASMEHLQAYLDPLRAMRVLGFQSRLEGLAKGVAVVNPPSLFQGYSIGLYEGMAAGRPVISWDVTDRLRNRALFVEGEEILLFPKNNPEKLASLIEGLIRDPQAAGRLAHNASKKLWRFHTSEKRVRQAMHWIETGAKPILEDRDLAPSVGIAMEAFWKRFGTAPSAAAGIPDRAAEKPGGAASAGKTAPVNQASLGDSYAAARDFQKASLAYLRAIESAPKDIGLWIKCAHVCIQGNNAQMAAVALEGALALDPENADAKALAASLAGSPDGKAPDSGASGNLKKADIDRYYEEFFLRSPEYASREPNPEELARWNKIEVFLRKTRDEWQARGKGPLRILDLGCGRGWLTNRASLYGEAEGMEPVAGVIDGARKLFPNLKFYACEAAQLRKDPAFRPYDLILNSEVIEHVPWSHKEEFVDALKSLLTPEGIVILTTPRGEVFNEYMPLVNFHGQPIEDWMTEEQVKSAFQRRGFTGEGPERIWARFPECVYFPSATPEQEKAERLMSIYQIWRFRAA